MRSHHTIFGLIVCLVAWHAQAQQVTIKANQNPGDVYNFDQAMTMQLNMTISMNGQQQQVQQNMGQNRAGKVQVIEAQGGQATKASVAFGPNCTGYMETVGQGKQDQPFALTGQTVTAVRQPDGSYTLDGGADAGEVDDYVKIEEGMFPKKPVSPGDTWEVAPEEFAKAMQMDPSAKGNAKARLVSVDSVGGRQVASIDLNLNLEGDQPGAGHMTMQLTGTVKIDVATGRTVGGNLAGPLTMAGQPQPGMDMKGNGRLNLTFNGSVAGGGGVVVNPNPIPNPNPNPVPAPNPGPNPFDPGAGAANFVGDFNNEKLQMHITKGAFEEDFNGLITMKGNMYKFTAKAQGSTLTGKFQVEANSFDFTATLNGNQMTFKTGSSTYDLKRENAAKNPLE